MPPEVIPNIIDEYLGNISDAEAKRNAFQEFLADMIIILPAMNFSRSLQGEPILFTCHTLPILVQELGYHRLHGPHPAAAPIPRFLPRIQT